MAGENIVGRLRGWGGGQGRRGMGWVRGVDEEMIVGGMGRS